MSLYRKYRPQTFEDVVGQEHVAHTLRNALGAEPIRVAHAYLFCGPRGTGKTTTARLLAKCLNCEQGPTAIPCNQCDFCVRVRDNNAVMDLIEIDAASNTGVDNVRENIIEKVNVAPAVGRYRVYIIDEVHMLSTSSFNALLKTLEEPPAHAIFVLATTDAHKVPATITSRCQRFDFRRVGPQDIVKRLQYVAQAEGIELQEAAARLIAQTADGALRDALTLLEQVAAFSPGSISEADVRVVLGTVSQELLMALMDAVTEANPAEVLTQIENATEEGVSFMQLARDLTHYCRELLLLTVGYEGSSGFSTIDKKRRHKHSTQLGRERLMVLVDALRQADKEMRQSTDHRLLLELTLVRATAPLPQVVAAAPVATAASAPATAAPAPAWRQPEKSAAPKPAPVKPAKVESPEPEAAPEHERPDVAALEAAAQAEATEPAPAPAESAASKKGRRIRDFDEFVELWPAVLMRVKKKIGVSAVAYLHDALPVGLTPEEAILEFQKEFHYAKACEAAGRLPFEQVLNECMDSPRRLKFKLAAPKEAPPPEPEPEPPNDDDDEEDVFKLAQSMFGAQVVGRSGGG